MVWSIFGYCEMIWKKISENLRLLLLLKGCLNEKIVNNILHVVLMNGCYNLPQNIWDPLIPLSNVIDENWYNRGILLIKKKILFNTGKRGEGMLHTFRMIFLLKLTAVSICFVEGCRLTKFVTVFLLGEYK